MKLLSCVERITPETAVKWLAKNHAQNRPLRESRIRQYAADIVEGRWRVTHQGIAFDKDETLLDGQHRLHAIVRAGIPCDMMVTRGLTLETFALLDQGAHRTAGDILRLPTWHVASLRCLIALERYQSNISNRARPHEIELRQKQGTDAIEIIRGLHPSNTGFTIAPVIGAMAYAHPIDPTAAESFFSQVARGELLERTDPAYRLRAWIEARRAGGITGSVGWLTMMATLQAFHHMLVPGTHKIANLHAGETGYRVISGRRRARGIPNTPSAQDLPVSPAKESASE